MAKVHFNEIYMPKEKRIESIIRWLDTTIEYLIYASLVLVPLIFLPFVSSVFTTPKLYVFRVITLVIVFLWAMKFIFKKETKIRKTPFVFFLSAYAVVCVVTTFFSVSIASSVIGTYGRFIGLATILNLLLWVYIVIAVMSDKSKIRKAMWASVITALFVVVYGLLQYFDLLTLFNWSQNPSERMFSTIGHSNHVAAYLGMNLMLLIGICVSTPFSWRKIFLHLVGFVFFVAIILTASRAGIFATVAVLLIWGIYALKIKGARKYFMKKGKVFLFLFMVLFLAGVLFQGHLKQLEIVERTKENIEFFKEGNIPDRLSWWASSIEMIKDKPFIGHGLSTYRDVYNQYRRADYNLPGNAQDYITPESAHMEYLTIWIQQGTLGILVYIMMLVAVFYYAVRYLKKEDDYNNKVIAFSLLSALMVYLFQALLSFGVITTLFLFYTIMGILIAYIEREDLKWSKSSGSSAKKSVKGGSVKDGSVKANAVKTGFLSAVFFSSKQKYFDFKINFVLRVIVSIILIILVSVGCIYTLCFLASDYHNKQADIFASVRKYRESVQSYEKSVYYMPFVSEYYEDFADFTFNLGLKMPEASQAVYMSDSIDFYDRAIKLAPTIPHLHANRGLVASRLAALSIDNEKRDFYREEALKSMQRAVELSKNTPIYHYKYAKQLIFFDEIGKAVEQLHKVIKIRPDYQDTQELIRLHSQAIGSAANSS